MNFEGLIGKTFQENEFYELLLFEIEENFNQYFSKSLHIYFARFEETKIIITEVVYFKDAREMDKEARKFIEKRAWFQIYENHGHIDLLLCRFDRTGISSSVHEDSTDTQSWKTGWIEEKPDLGPMTREEIRQAVLELSGYFEDEQASQKLPYKKSA